MKVSRYSFFTKAKNSFLVYHQLTQSLIAVDEALFCALKEGNIASIDTALLNSLNSMGIVIDEDINEEAIVMTANIRERYQSDALRVTILPTLSCNFSCWYCYEKHSSSLMEQDAIFSLIDFIKRETSQRNKKTVLLDWFGGEPLLCFERVIVPISLEISEWCKQKNIHLHNMITTNGSLIDEGMAIKMSQIDLSQFQITLDGGKESHNKTRFSSKIPNSYELIVKNIHLLCKHIPNANIELRVNYTPENVNSLEEILEAFDPDIRSHVTISPHIVWQKSQHIKGLSNQIDNFIYKAINSGYHNVDFAPKSRCISCYTENMDQYVINYNLDVYKCTARDFDGKFCIGQISKDGSFIPNGLYYDYIATKSPFINDKCLKCEILPSWLCSSSCIQKTIEGEQPICYKDLHKSRLDSYIINQISK